MSQESSGHIMIPEDVYLAYLDHLIIGARTPCAIIVQELLSKAVDVRAIYPNVA